jgi:hypothetical protein
MFTRPTIVEVIEGVMTSLVQDLGPELQTTQAKIRLQLNQTLLQCVIQRIQQEPQLMVTEHNEMTALYRALADRLRDSQGEAAVRIRERSEQLGKQADLPAPLAQTELAKAHSNLTAELVKTLGDLDELIRTGDASAADGLQLVRGHLALRSLRDFQALMVNQGALVGRG